MTAALLTILVPIFGVAIAQGAQMCAGNRRLDARMDRIGNEANGLGEEVVHLSGLVEGLQTGVAHNRAA